ncbi:MAG: hypothetical protein OIF58_16475, partial [Cohaesibacter sp.]|nr:hypothetical protein [Cohaesibacter sp.]
MPPSIMFPLADQKIKVILQMLRAIWRKIIWHLIHPFVAQDFLRSLEKIVQAKIIPTQLSVCPLGKGSNCYPNLISRS